MNAIWLGLRLPGVLHRAHHWVRKTVAESYSHARPIAELNLAQLDKHFDAELLGTVRLVACDRVPTPPYKQWGLPAEAIGRLAFDDPAGITLDSMVFVRSGLERDDSLVFHELVHAIQWRSLGPRAFLALYGLCLLRVGYHEHPLERTAYTLQRRFDAGELNNLMIHPLVERCLQEDLVNFQRQSILNRIAFGVARLWDRWG